jgi:formate dehydrogenase assembly factor FdhD
VHLIKEKLSSAESRFEAAETAHQADMEKLRRQLADAKKAAEADRHRHESLLKEMEDRFISFVRDVFRHNH